MGQREPRAHAHARGPGDEGPEDGAGVPIADAIAGLDKRALAARQRAAARTPPPGGVNLWGDPWSRSATNPFAG